jgi:3D (Asp-Asp-Asp) domain-containing protein
MTVSKDRYKHLGFGLLLILPLMFMACRTQGKLFTISAYCSCKKCCGKWSGITKTGKKLTKGMCAVDPKVIPLGNRIVIEGVGTFIAEDTGSAVKGKKIDIYMETHEQAKNFGVQKHRVWVMWEN